MSTTVPQAPGLKRTDVQEHDLSVPGRRVIQNRVDITPDAPLFWHKHPGEEVIYVLEGSLQYDIDGQPPRRVSAGEGLTVPADTIHAVKNISTGNAAELATYIVEEGKPFLVMSAELAGLSGLPSDEIPAAGPPPLLLSDTRPERLAMRTITLEEHFVSRRFLDGGFDLGAQRGLDLASSEVSELSELRLRHMDESGIDMQVISHVLPTFAPISPSQDQDIATAANEQAAAAIAAHPDRFAAFAALPMSDPHAAVAELRRAVTRLGFVGALINGRPNGTFLDAPAYRPLFQTAVELDVPLYLHPGPPTATLREEHYSGLGPSVSYALATTAWGWHAETGLHALRLIAAGIFNQFPTLQIILGHMGEMIPFMLNRADEWLTPPARTENNLQLSVAETFRRNFWITTSGMFSSPQFLLVHQVLGPDRLLFSIDYPFSPNTQGRAFLDALEINPTDKEKLSHRNAERLLHLPSIVSASPQSWPDQ